MSAPQMQASTRIRVQVVEIIPNSPPDYSIGIKLLLNDRVHQRIGPVPVSCPLRWDYITPIDAKPSENIELRVYEYHLRGYRKIRIGTVMFQAHQANASSIKLTDNTGLVPCTVEFTFLPPDAVPSMPHLAHSSALAAVAASSSVLESMGKARDMAGTVLKIGQQVSELNPVAKAALGLCNLAWQTLERQDRYDKLVADLVLGMGNLLPLVEVLESRSKIEQLQATIVEILRLVEDASRFVIDYQSGGPAVRTIRAFISSTAQEQVDEFLKQFGRLKREFDTGVAIHVALEIKAVLKDADQDLLKRLLTLDSGYNPSAGCLKGTRAEVQTDIRQWFNNDDSTQSIYWLSGLAGSGKSTIAHSTCEWLYGRGYLSGSFFCKRDNQQLSRPENIVSTLAAGLAFKYRPYGTSLVSALREEPQISSAALAIRFRGMIVEPFRSVGAAKLPQRLAIVVDALDECGTVETRVQLTTCLLELVQLVPWMKIVITSRPNPELRSLLNGALMLHRDLFHEDRLSATHDIELLIRHRLTELMDDDDEAFQHRTWLVDETVALLTAKATGLFIWAQTACNVICNSLNPDKKIREMLSEVPSRDATTQLHLLYDTVLHDALGNIAGSAHVIRACIAAVVVTRAPLDDVSLARLLGERVDLTELRSVVRRLSSVIYRDSHGSICVLHQSFSDYMLTEDCSLDYRINQTHENLDFGVSCVRIMTEELKFNICQLEDSELYNHQVLDLDNRIQEKIPSYLRYSCVYWVDHLVSTNASETTPEAYQSTLAFLAGLLREPQVLYWIEVMSLLGNLHECELALVKLRSWIKPAGHKLQKCVEELRQFVTNFYLPISQSTPHLYVSALAIGCEAWDALQNLPNNFPNRLRMVQGKHLAGLPNRCLRPISQPSPVIAMAYSPDGRLLVTVHSSGEARILNALTSAVMLAIPKDSNITSIAISPDSPRFASGSSDGRIQVWDLNTGLPIFDPLLAHAARVTSVNFSPNGQRIISGSADKTIRVWALHTDLSIFLVLHSPRPLTSISISQDGSQIVSSSTDAIIRLWDTLHNGCKTPRLLRGHSRAVQSVRFSPDKQHILSSSFGGSVRVWNRYSGSTILVLPHLSIGATVAYSPDGRHIVAGLWDGEVRVYDAQTGSLALDPLIGHSAPVYSVIFSPDGHRIASASGDCTVLLWDACPRTAVPNPLQGHSDMVRDVAFSPGNRLIASVGAKDYTVQVWDAHTGALVLGPFRGHLDNVASVAFSPDGQLIASGSWDKTVRVWDANTGAAILGPLCHTGLVESVSFSHNGQWIIASDETVVRLWDAQSGVAFLDLREGHPGYRISRVYSPASDDRHIFSAFLSASLVTVTLVVWDVHTGVLVRSFEKRCDRGLMHVALSPDGRLLAASTLFGEMSVWDISSETLIFHVAETCESFHPIAFSPDSQRIVSMLVSTDDILRVRVWDIQSHREVLVPLRLQDMDPAAMTVVFSPDGQRIVSGHGSGEVRVWDVSDPSSPEAGQPHDFPRSGSLSRVPSHELRDSSKSEGWVKNDDGKLLLWLPFACRRCCIDDSLFAISTRSLNHPVSFDFTRFKWGRDWSSIHTSNHGEF